jgi:predicted metalloendopeptidase
MVEEFLVSAQFDVHSPGFARVLGSVSNSLPFANAFGCPIDAPMNPASKCTLW